MARQGRRAAVEGEWVLGRRRAPIVIEGPTAYRPDLVLLVEAASGFVIASDVVHPEASADEVADRVEGLLKPGVSLRVDDEQIADALRARLGPDQPVRVGPVPELRAPLAALSRFMGGGGGSRREEPLWTDEASAEARIGFIQAAARFERSAPWEAAGDGQVLRLDVPALGWEGACASILGAAGEEFGLLLLRSLEDFVAFTRLAGEPRRPANRRRGIGIPLLSVNFDDPDAITGGHVLAKRARAHGWQPGPEGRLAYLLKMGPDRVAQPLTTDDYGVATASLEAVRQFVEKHRRLFERPTKERIEEQLRIVMPAGDVEVRAARARRRSATPGRWWTRPFASGRAAASRETAGRPTTSRSTSSATTRPAAALPKRSSSSSRPAWTLSSSGWGRSGREGRAPSAPPASASPAAGDASWPTRATRGASALPRRSSGRWCARESTPRTPAPSTPS